MKHMRKNVMPMLLSGHSMDCATICNTPDGARLIGLTKDGWNQTMMICKISGCLKVDFGKFSQLNFNTVLNLVLFNFQGKC